MFADSLQYARYGGECGRVDSEVLKSHLHCETFLDSLGSQCPLHPLFLLIGHFWHVSAFTTFRLSPALPPV